MRKWVYQQEDQLRVLVSAPAADGPTVDALRKSVKELQGEMQLSLIRIQEGEEVYKKFVQGSASKALGLTDEQLKLLSACKKEVAEDRQKRQKDEKTPKMPSPYGRTGDRFHPGYTAGRKFPHYLPETEGGFRPTFGGVGDRGFRVEVDEANSKCARCHVYGHWHRDGLCKPEDVARVGYLRSTHNFSTPALNYGSGPPGSYPHGADAFNQAGDGYGQDGAGFLAIQNHHNKGN